MSDKSTAGNIVPIILVVLLILQNINVSYLSNKNENLELQLRNCKVTESSIKTLYNRLNKKHNF